MIPRYKILPTIPTVKFLKCESSQLKPFHSLVQHQSPHDVNGFVNMLCVLKLKGKLYKVKEKQRKWVISLNQQ